MSDLVLRLERISKRFGPLLANDDVSLSLGRSEVLALLGENGAGKTTLMNILFGHYTADEGRVFVFGRELPRGRPRAAIAAGVGMVHQHFALADNLSVLENVMAGTERLWRLRANAAAARRKLLALSERFSLVVDPGARVGDLSVGERQRVENSEVPVPRRAHPRVRRADRGAHARRRRTVCSPRSGKWSRRVFHSSSSRTSCGR